MGHTILKVMFIKIAERDKQLLFYEIEKTWLQFNGRSKRNHNISYKQETKTLIL